MFQEHIDESYRLLGREVKNWHDAEVLVVRSNLTPLIGLSTREWIYRESHADKRRGHLDWDNWEHTWGSTIILHLYIPFTDKSIARDLFFELGYEASKGYGIDTRSWKECYYVETWTWKENDEEDRWSTNTIEIKFYRPVKEGDIVNGCAVKRIENESIHSYLAIVCDKDG